jgi:hypothetical protein
VSVGANEFGDLTTLDTSRQSGKRVVYELVHSEDGTIEPHLKISVYLPAAEGPTSDLEGSLPSTSRIEGVPGSKTSFDEVLEDSYEEIALLSPESPPNAATVTEVAPECVQFSIDQPFTAYIQSLFDGQIYQAARNRGSFTIKHRILPSALLSHPLPPPKFPPYPGAV